MAATERYPHYLLGDRDLDTFKAFIFQGLADSVMVYGCYQNYLLRDLTDAAECHPGAHGDNAFVPHAYRQDDTGTWQPVDVTSPAGLDLVYSTTTLVTALVDRGTHQETCPDYYITVNNA